MSQAFQRIILVLAIPVLIFLIVHYLQKAYLADTIDPDYYYLMNALHLSQGYPTDYCHHPGVPTQVMGAIVIRIIHLFSDEPSTAKAVLQHSKWYLNSIHRILSILFTLCLIFGSDRILKNHGRIPCLLFQSVFLISMVCVESMTGFRSEVTVVGLNALFVSYLLCQSEKDDIQHPFRRMILFSLVIAFGVACRIPYAPVVLIPMILLIHDRKMLAGFLILTPAAFLLFISPLTSFHEFAKWIYVLIFRKGHAGDGERGLLDVSSFVHNLIDIIAVFPLPLILILISLVIIAFQWNRERRTFLKQHLNRLFLGSTLAECFVIGMVAKSPADRYLIPALSLLGINLVLIHRLIGKSPYPRLLNGCLMTSLCVGLIPGYFYLKKSEAYLDKRIQACAQIEKRIAQNPLLVVSSYGSSTVTYGLKFGCDFSRNRYAVLLDQLHPNVIFYNLWHKNFSSYSKMITPADLPKVFYLEGFNLKNAEFGRLPADQFQCEELYESGTKALYKVTRIETAPQ